MKIKLSTFILTLLSVTTLYPAEYNGKNIDGIQFDCSAYSYDTGNWYYVTVEFEYDEATIYFDNGGYITLDLDNEVIDDPSSIEAYDYDKGVYWELEVDGL
tara:strand:+ start:229 stop:531 length:303 start_codon:yes stop_codon:yes gene_type:complete